MGCFNSCHVIILNVSLRVWAKFICNPRFISKLCAAVTIEIGLIWKWWLMTCRYNLPISLGNKSILSWWSHSKINLQMIKCTLSIVIIIVLKWLITLWPYCMILYFCVCIWISLLTEFTYIFSGTEFNISNCDVIGQLRLPHFRF